MKHVGFRIIAGLVLVAAIAAIAFFAFNAGMARGAAMNIQLPAAPANGQALPLPYGYYGMPFGFHHPFFFGFGCFGVLIPLFLLFVALGAARRMAFGPRFAWRHHMHGHPFHAEGGVPPAVAEMHRKLHEADDAQKKEQS